MKTRKPVYRFYLILITVAVAIVFISGCVSQKPLDQLKTSQEQTDINPENYSGQPAETISNISNPSRENINVPINIKKSRASGEPDPANFKEKIISEQFIIYYNTDGAEAATHEFADEVKDALEFSYNKLVNIDGFRPPLILPINIYLTGKSMDMMGSVKGNGPKGLYGRFNPKLREDKDAQPGNSVFAHELFHAIQKGYDETEGSWLREATANWAAYDVYPAENFWAKRGTGWLIWPDLKDFEQIEYESGAFWVWFAGKYGGVMIMKKIFEASVDYEGTYIIDKVLEGTGKTFDDVWAEFAVSLYTRDFADKEAANALYSKTKKETIPVTVADLIWNGEKQVLDRVQNEYDSGGKNKGEPLQIVHGHGLGYVKITPSSGKTLKIIFEGDSKTKFFVKAVGKKADSYKHFEFSDKEALVEKPTQFEEIMIIIVRSKEGTGYYSVRLTD